MILKKFNLKDYIMIGMFIVLLCSVAANYYQYYFTNKAKQEAADKTQAIKTTISDLKRITDSAGREHIVFNSNENVIKKEQAKFAKTLDTVASAIGLKKNDQITDYTKVAVIASTAGAKAKETIDTEGRPIAIFKDKVFSATYHKPFGPDSIGTFDLSANINLSYTNYRKRAWILGALKSYTDIYSDDPRIKILGASHLVILQPEPAFGARLRAAATYNPSLKSLSMGPEASFDFGKNQIRINYYYNFASNAWRPTISLTRDIIRL